MMDERTGSTHIFAIFKLFSYFFSLSWSLEVGLKRRHSLNSLSLIGQGEASKCRRKCAHSYYKFSILIPTRRRNKNTRIALDTWQTRVLSSKPLGLSMAGEMKMQAEVLPD